MKQICQSQTTDKRPHFFSLLMFLSLYPLSTKMGSWIGNSESCSGKPD